MSNAFFDTVNNNYKDRSDVVLRFSAELTYSGPEFLSLVEETSAKLRQVGLRAGDRIALEAFPKPLYIAAVVASLANGAIVVPINPNATIPEVDYIFDDATPKFAIGDGGSFQSAAKDRIYGPKSYVGVGGDLEVPTHCNLLNTENILQRTSPLKLVNSKSEAEIRSFKPIEAPSLIGYTSGTTGKPKGALLSLGNLYSSAKGLVSAWNWTKDDHLLHFLPLYHMHGLGVGLIGSLVAGSKITFLERFSEDLLFESIASEEISMIFGVPTIYERIARDTRLADLNKLRILVSGSAPLPMDLFNRLKGVLGEGPVERYGMTETVMNTSNPFNGERKAGKVGVALNGVSIKIASDGEVLVKGDNVMIGYLGRPSANEEAFTPDGYFKTGDQGEIDEDGYLEIKGRKKDLIISGGFNVYPKEVETELRSFRGIREAAVVGRPSELWGEEVVAFVECSEKVDVSKLRELLKDRLSAYKVPKEIFIVEELPRNNLGKVLYGQIRQSL